MSGCGECGTLRADYSVGFYTGWDEYDKRIRVVLGLWAFLSWVRLCEAERRSFYEGVAEGFFRSPGRFRR